MLSDLFANFEIDEAETNKERGKQCTPEDYLAENHYVGWFLNKASLNSHKTDEDRELISYKAAYFYHNSKYKEAFDIPSFPVELLLSHLHDYELCALDYGDQLQYLSMKKDVYAVVTLPDASQNFIDTVCLLCASVDLPEHWLAFGQRRSLNVGDNFRIGYMTRAVLLLERHSKHAHGFVSRVIKKKMIDLREQLAEIGSHESLEEARQKMGFDMVSHDETVESSEEKSQPVHDSRSKIEVYKSAEECQIIIERFKCKFSWMFEGCALR
ncbi:hypothetical protein TELCIR_00767 [Teladorsagia circumcincta]|uniref:Uncharacterized protein n=1 Tax=Teladorsagia circumcincta TaxID=45464 RepID=A0A2G9V3Q7_TELCI|nr:hypothetical protein TELCIR_00767 [Teladorsagia circumcincta]